MAGPVESLQHDTARATAYALVDIVCAVLREEEVVEALREYYAVLRAALEAYDMERMKILINNN